jgi:UDP-2,3-diacylglucosamine pyrophosphatase LpxH
VLGDTMYTVILALNHQFNRVRARLGFGYWSLSQYLKHRAKAAVSFITDFEVALARAARERGLDGVVCGHIHKAEIRMIDGILYCNDGDWVESLTALVEDEHGQLRLVQWSEIRADETPLLAGPTSSGRSIASPGTPAVEAGR